MTVAQINAMKSVYGEDKLVTVIIDNGRRIALKTDDDRASLIWDDINEVVIIKEVGSQFSDGRMDFTPTSVVICTPYDMIQGLSFLTKPIL